MIFLATDRIALPTQLFEPAQDRALAGVNWIRNKLSIFRRELSLRFARLAPVAQDFRPTPPLETAELISGEMQWERLAGNLRLSIGGAATAKSLQELAAVKLDAAVYELEGLVGELGSVMRVVRSVAGAPVIGRIGPVAVSRRESEAIAA